MRTPLGRPLIAAAVLTLIGAVARADAPPASQEPAKLHALFDQEWQWTLKEYPEFATGVGDNR